MKLWKIFGIAFLAGLLSVGSVYADVNTQIGKIDNELALGLRVRLFNNYSRGVGAEHFSGSTTASGGTTTAQWVNVESFTGTKHFGFWGSSTATGGTVSVKIYGVFGTSTAPTGTSGACLLMNPYITGNTVIATSTTFAITQNPCLIGATVEGLSGTYSTTLDMATFMNK